MNLNDATGLAYSLMNQHGLLSNGWMLKLDSAVKRFGQCSYRRKTISLSEPLILLNDVQAVRDVILHEIAHALTPGAHHGYTWRRKCIEIGAKPERCYSYINTNTPQLPYFATCGACGREHQRVRRVEPHSIRACNCQSGKPWSQRVLLTYTKR